MNLITLAACSSTVKPGRPASAPLSQGGESHPHEPAGAFTATFSAEAWVNDQAIEVDPEGPTEWDCTTAVFEHLAYFQALGLDSVVDGLVDNDDVLKGDPAAPEWIQEWRGPFTITVWPVQP